jgi:hypothetical protein
MSGQQLSGVVALDAAIGKKDASGMDLSDRSGESESVEWFR